jgi:NADPH2:quinone reductase
VLAVRVDAHGGPEVLRAVELPEPVPGPGAVLVRHEVVGVNYVDTQHRAGTPYPVELPLIPGIEAAGTVAGLGQGVDGVRVGDRVAYAGPMVGVYAELAAVPRDVLVPVPDGLPSNAAAAVLLQGMTAHAMTHDVVDSRRVDLVEAVRAIVPDGVDVVYDSVGRATFEASLRAVRPMGLIVAFGQSSGPVAPMDVARLSGLTGEGLPGSLWLTWPALTDYNSTREALAGRAAAVFEAVLNGTVTPAIAESLPLRDAARAHELLEARSVIGKILLEV